MKLNQDSIESFEEFLHEFNSCRKTFHQEMVFLNNTSKSKNIDLHNINACHKHIKNIIVNLETIFTLIEQLEIETTRGDIKRSRNEIELHSLVHKAYCKIERMNKTKGMKFLYSSLGQTKISCYESAWMIFSYIVENYSKYALKGTEIEVKAIYRNSNLEVIFEGQCPKLTDEDYEKAFEKNYHGSNVDGLESGSGKGLYFAKKEADENDFSIDIDNHINRSFFHSNREYCTVGTTVTIPDKHIILVQDRLGNIIIDRQ